MEVCEVKQFALHILRLFICAEIFKGVKGVKLPPKADQEMLPKVRNSLKV